MEAPIININSKFDREKFERIRKREIEDKKKRNCNHDETTFDGEIDEVICDNCTQKWSSFDYLWFIIDEKRKVTSKVFQIENSIHFLNEEKIKLLDDILFLKKEKRKLRAEIKSHEQI